MSEVKPLHRPPPARGVGLSSQNCFLHPFSSLLPVLASCFLPPSAAEVEKSQRGHTSYQGNAEKAGSRVGLGSSSVLAGRRRLGF